MKKTVYFTHDGKKLTFVEHPEFDRALEILATLSDGYVWDKVATANILREHELNVAASEIEKMSLEEYFTFISQNLEIV